MGQTSDRDLSPEEQAKAELDAERETAKRETEAARAKAEAEVAEALQEGHERMR
jgi:phage gp16-like protein